MESHLDATGLHGVPRTLHVGSSRILDNQVQLVNVFGAQGPWSPGWYLLGQPAGRQALPLAGPFDSEPSAVYAWEMSKRAYTAWHNRLGTVGAGTFAFMAQSAMLYDPVTILRPESLVMNHAARVDSFVKLECGEGLLLGPYVHIASFCHLGIGGGVVVFEEGASAGSGTKVLSGSASFEGPSWSATHPLVVNKKTTTRIRRNATLLVNSVVLSGCDIGEGAVIAAGAVVLANTTVPAGEVWGGVPAKRLMRAGGSR